MLEMRTRWRSVVATAIALQVCAAGAATAEPMRLSDPTPRWVIVQFEDSPSDRPEHLDRVYTKPYAAWLESDARGHVIVRVDGEVLEKSLFRENDPVPGSFSDYVWVFDPDSGDVLSATFKGAFRYEIDWGLATTEVRARVEAVMQTTRSGGLREAKPLWGTTLHPFCDEPGRDGCREVARASYDPARGYVNAPGYLSIDSPVTSFDTYSAVGEARFSEVPRDPAVLPQVAGGPPDGPGEAAGPIGALTGLPEAPVVFSRARPDREPAAPGAEVPVP